MNSIRSSRPPSWTVWLTAPAVVLTRRRIVPPSCTFSSANAALPEKKPAKPEAVRTNAPSPSVSSGSGLLSSQALTPVSATIVTGAPPGGCWRWNRKVPLRLPIVVPAGAMVRRFASAIAISTRTNDPAGRMSRVAVVPTVNVSSTAPGRVLTWTRTDALGRLMSSGTVIAAVAANPPATPSGAMMSWPWPALTSTTFSSTSSVTFEAAIFTTVAPPTVDFSSVNVPLSFWPAMVTSPLAETRTRPAAVSIVALTVTVEANATPGTATVAVPLVSVPVTPVAAMVRLADCTVTTTRPPASSSDAPVMSIFVPLSVRWKATSPESSCPSTAIVRSSPAKRRKDVPPGSTSCVSTPPTRKVSFTSAPVVLSWSVTVPASETPGTLVATVPVSSAARLVASSSSRLPAPLVSVMTGWPPASSENATFRAPTRTTSAVLLPTLRFVRSNEKSPVSDCETAPIVTESVSAVASMRRYGPAGRSPAGAAVVLTATARVIPAVMPNSASAAPVVTVAWSRPATPSGLTVSEPVPLLRLRNAVVPSPIDTWRLETSSWVTEPAPDGRCSKLNVPETDCPAIASVAEIALSRTYGPGRSATEELLSAGSRRTGSAAVAAVLRNSWKVAVVGVTPGTRTCTVPPKAPAAPALETRSWPFPSVSRTSGGPRAPVAVSAPRSSKPSEVTEMRMPAFERVTSTVAVSTWPATCSWMPLPVAETYATSPFAFSSSVNAMSMSFTVSPSRSEASVNAWSDPFARTLAWPATLADGSPTSCRSPSASIANTSAATKWTSWTLAFVSRIPRASGFVVPSASVGGPSPKKTLMFEPTRISASRPLIVAVVIGPNVPSIVRKPPIWIAALLTLRLKTFPSVSEKAIESVRPPTTTVAFTAAPVVLTRSSPVPPAFTPSVSISTVPER